MHGIALYELDMVVVVLPLLYGNEDRRGAQPQRLKASRFETVNPPVDLVIFVHTFILHGK